MKIPPYEIKRAEILGRDAACDFMRQRIRWPLSKEPENPYAPMDQLWKHWRDSYNITLERMKA